jgi:hypothetical protein
VVAKLGSPTRPLPSDELPAWTWKPRQKLIRVYHAHTGHSGRQHRFYGPLNRFDHQVRDRHQQPKLQPDGRGVIYLAETLGTALAEAFQSQGVEVGVCPNMRAVPMAPPSATALLDLTGDGVMKIGALAGLAAGHYPRRVTQRWGRAIYEDLKGFAGIRYRGAHQSGICVVGWERTSPLAFADDEDLELDELLWDRVVVALADQWRVATKINFRDCPECQRGGATSRLTPF